MKKLIIFFAVIITAVNVSVAQMGNFKYGLKLYNQLAYSKAIPYFEKSLQADSTNASAIRMLAECYRQVTDVENTKKMYAKVVALPDVKPIEKFYYGQALMMSGDYDQAKPWLEAFREDERGKLKAEGINNLHSFFKDSAQYTVKNLQEINTAASEMGPAFFGKSILISSNRRKIDNLNNSHDWTGKDFYKLYKADEENISNVMKFAGDVQTKYNVGPVYYDFNGKILFLTRNKVEKRRAVKSGDDQVKLGIYSYKYDAENEQWEDEQSFAYNNQDYNVAHPSVSADGKWMVFASDMPGGMGGMDLWACELKSGQWANPFNLGAEINTKGNEVFPFVSTSNLLFYSSDGKEGLGGLDVYFSAFKNGKAGEAKTISFPVNSMGDDFSFILSHTGNIAYFASNRPGGKGDDDIYLINVLKPFRASMSVSGTAKDIISGQPLAGTLVILNNNNGEKLGEITTAEDGFYEFEVDPEQKYMIAGTKPEYSDDKKNFTAIIPQGQSELVVDLSLGQNNFSLFCLVSDKKTGQSIGGVTVKIKNRDTGREEFSFTTSATGDWRTKLEEKNLNDKINYQIYIEKDGYLGKSVAFSKVLDKPGEIALHEVIDISLDPIEVGLDLAKIIDIKPIYFDLSKWNIRPDAATELDKIVKVMQENPTMVIELGSHTDCRSSSASNMTLSDKRAKASATYIISKGIDKSRIYGKGYGETKLVNDCACEGNVKSDCDEERHQQNRRTEFIIVKM
jgi:outer membrane protein OmpA-like peptidoglycan-associated protein/tetratricopeptide (TPR) repeat protein